MPTEHKYPSEQPSAAKPRRAHRTSTGESPEHRDHPVGPIGRARSSRITALVLRPRVAWIHSARFFLAPLRSSSDRTRRLTRPIPRSIGLTGATRDTHSRIRHTHSHRDDVDADPPRADRATAHHHPAPIALHQHPGHRAQAPRASKRSRGVHPPTSTRPPPRRLNVRSIRLRQ